MKTVMPFPGGDQVVFLHALVRLGKTRYQSNNIELRLEVISRAFKLVALVHMNDIVRLWKTRYQSNNIGPRLKVISHAFELVALLHMNNIVLHKS